MVGLVPEPVDATPDELPYLLARASEDYLASVRALLGMSVWLPVRGERRQLVVRQQGDRRLVRAYTSAARLPGPDSDSLVRRFSELIGGWRDHQIGLVVNPDTDSELQLPAHLFPQILALGEEGGLPERSSGTLPDISPPDRIGDIRFAALYDGVAEGRPVISPSRPRITDPTEKARIAAYLAGGVLLQAAAGMAGDVFDDTRGRVVPAHTRTDGTWVWQDGLAYYLTTYDLGPEPDFYNAIVAHGYTCPEPSPEQVRAAGRALLEQQRITSELHRRWRASQ